MRRLSLGVVLLVVLPLVAVLAPVPTPAGAAPVPGVRYVDVVFNQVTVTKDLTYGSSVNDKGQTQTLKLDLYRPTGDTVTDRPAVVVVHGGAFIVGNKSNAAIWADDLARRGYVAVSINYRLASQSPGSSQALISAIYDAKRDAQAAVRWLRKNATTYGIDPDRIGMTGSSAGGVTSLAVAFDSEDVGESGNPGYPSNVNAVVSNSGSMGTALQTPDDVPHLMLNGTTDPTVSYAAAKATCDKSTDVGLWCTLVTFPGVGHTVGVFEPELTKTLTATYFYDHLVRGIGEGTPPLPDSVTFVHRQYRDLLLRDADPGGLDYWARRLAKGTNTPAQVVDALAQSPEVQRTIGAVTRSFIAYLGRPPDPSGLNYWVGKLRGGTSVSKMNATLAASSEFANRQSGLTDSEFIDALYQDLLARTPDPGGKAHWMNKLATGTTRAAVVSSFVTQPETIRATAPDVAVSIGTVSLLGRPPTSAERTEWAAKMRSGTPAAEWYEFVLASAEYEARVTP